MMGDEKQIIDYIDGLVQGRCNSSALAMELRLSCTNPSTCSGNSLLPVRQSVPISEPTVTYCQLDPYD